MLLVGIALFGWLLSWEHTDDESINFGQNVIIFALVNLNIAILCVLLFLIGRNIIKLVFDRKKRILGSKLRTRLVLIFVGLTLLPSTFVFVMASGFLNRAVEGWFNTQVETSVSAAVQVAQSHFEYLKKNIRNTAAVVAKELELRADLFQDRTKLETFMEELRKKTNLYGIRIFQDGKSEIAEVHNAAAYVESFQEPEPGKEAISRTLRKEEPVLFEERGANQFIRAYQRVDVQGKPLVLIATLRIEPELSEALALVTDSYREYEQLKLFKNPLASGYTLTLAMITGLVIFGSIWIAFFIARQIVVPIQKLAEGTRAIARGDYDIQIKNPGDDEFGFLVKSFNSMVADLKYSRTEAEKRRIFIETILSNLAVGVIALDSDKQITSINQIAGHLFNLGDINQVVGKDLSSVLKKDIFEKLWPLICSSDSPSEGESRGPSEVEVQVSVQDQEHRVLCTAGVIRSPENSFLGTLLLFDDITDLVHAQAMSVWREVAQRIAHEIKNPLTPIQLSAQRLKKIVSEISGRSDLIESAETIVENVEAITHLANEFSKFARMPTADLNPADLNSVIADVVSTFAMNNSDIVFQFVADNKLPEISIDIGQIKSVLLNLIDNAVVAIHSETKRPEEADRAKIVIRTYYDKKEKKASFEVADNGPGIPVTDRFRIFEPYFTTKKGGMGLGLAIVNTIIADHQGEIRVYDNTPRGAKFIVELPASRRPLTQRKLAEA